MHMWKRRAFESRPVTRLEFSTGFGRWWATYAMPLVFSFLAVLLVSFALAEWLPSLFGIGVESQERFRLVGAAVFSVTYLLGVWAMKRSFRTRDSEFTE